jgi:phage protein D
VADVQHENFTILIDGKEITALYDDLITLEIELDEELAGMFRMDVTILLQPDGKWSHVDDEGIAVWKEVVITAGLEDDVQPLMSGYITHVRPAFGGGLDDCHLEIWGMDASVLMDRQDKLKDWASRKDSDIAEEIFGDYGFATQVESTESTHDEQMSTIIQRETDIQFLKRLALRNGYHCYVDGKTGVFGRPQIDADPQHVLSVQFGDETNVNWFHLDVDALATVDVAMVQIDHDTKDVLDAASAPGKQPALGAKPANAFLRANMQPGVLRVGKVATTGSAEMAALCQGLYDEGEWFVTGKGEIAANQYGSVLKPRAPVTIKGIGETHSGVYYVTHVNHVFNADGYIQRFQVKRNGLMPTGAEKFAADDGGLLGSL